MAFIAKYSDNSDIFSNEEIFHIAEMIGDKFLSEVKDVYRVSDVSNRAEKVKAGSDIIMFSDICNRSYVLARVVMCYFGDRILEEGDNQVISDKMSQFNEDFKRKDTDEVFDKFDEKIRSLHASDRQKNLQGILGFFRSAIVDFSEKKVYRKPVIDNGSFRIGFTGIGDYSARLDGIFEGCEKDIRSLYPEKVKSTIKEIQLN